MTIKELVTAIQQKHTPTGFSINPPATPEQIRQCEQLIGFELPPDFREFYSTCNGCFCYDFVFRMVTLDKDIVYAPGEYFVFAEYMAYALEWAVRKVDDGFEIFYNVDESRVLTSSLYEFLMRYYIGNVHEDGGLELWLNEV